MPIVNYKVSGLGATLRAMRKESATTQPLPRVLCAHPEPP